MVKKPNFIMKLFLVAIFAYSIGFVNRLVGLSRDQFVLLVSVVCILFFALRCWSSKTKDRMR